MLEIHSILKSTLLGVQFLAVLVGAFYLLKPKQSYWRWFIFYLIIIFASECFWMYNSSIDKQYRIAFYAFFGVPFQYIFLYWLYALKSLKNKRLFLLSVLIYIITMLVVVLFKNIDEMISITMNIGTLILMILLILEFVKQIKTDDILRFTENRMFYINIGMVLFYIGNYPFHILGPELYKNHLEIWNVYYIYFLTTNCIMYLLFTASLIWGKTR